MNRKILTILAVALLLCAFSKPKEVAKKTTQPTTQFKTLSDSVSYIIGFNIGKQSKEQEAGLNVDCFNDGMKIAIKGGKSIFTQEQEKDIMTKFQQVMQSKMNEKQKQISAENKAKGEAFLTKNKQNPNIKTTASGLQYEIVKQGTGATPVDTNIVKVHYEGSLIDGTVFDSSIKRGEPVEFGVTQVIKGWTEALKLMNVGSKYKLYIPSELGYGDQGAGQQIPPGSVLIFDVELLDIVKKEPKVEVKTEPATEPATKPTTK